MRHVCAILDVEQSHLRTCLLPGTTTLDESVCSRMDAHEPAVGTFGSWRVGRVGSVFRWFGGGTNDFAEPTFPVWAIHSVQERESRVKHQVGTVGQHGK